MESAACGFAIGVALARQLRGGSFLTPPPTTALGALLGHLRRPTDRFQPSNVLWSMFPDVELSEAARRNKGERRRIVGERALADLESWRARVDLSDDGRSPESLAQVAFE